MEGSWATLSLRDVSHVWWTLPEARKRDFDLPGDSVMNWFQKINSNIKIIEIYSLWPAGVCNPWRAVNNWRPSVGLIPRTRPTNRRVQQGCDKHASAEPMGNADERLTFWNLVELHKIRVRLLKYTNYLTRNSLTLSTKWKIYKLVKTQLTFLLIYTLE